MKVEVNGKREVFTGIEKIFTEMRRKQHGPLVKIRVSRTRNDFQRGAGEEEEEEGGCSPDGVSAVGQYSARFSRRMKFIVERVALSVIMLRKTHVPWT